MSSPTTSYLKVIFFLLLAIVGVNITLYNLKGISIEVKFGQKTEKREVTTKANLLQTQLEAMKTTTEPNDENRLRRRKLLFDRGCRGHTNHSYVPTYSYITVDEQHKMMICMVPKIGSSNWKRALLMLTGNYTSDDVKFWPALNDVSKFYKKLVNYRDPTRSQLLNNYTKIVFVRHPFSRFLSGYLNKISTVKLSENRQGLPIYKNFKNVTGISTEYVQFKDFVKYMILREDPPDTWNEHFKPVYYVCALCHVQYDVIGHLETIGEDGRYVLNEVGADFAFPTNQPKTSQGLSYSSKTDAMQKYFSDISKDEIKQLYRIYEMDFKLFGFTIPEYMNVTV